MKSTLRQNNIATHKNTIETKKAKEQEHEQMKKTLELIVNFLGEDFQKFKEQKSNTQ